MSTGISPTNEHATATVPLPDVVRAKIVIQGELDVPHWVHDLESFRTWVRADDFVCNGWVSYLNGEIWVDLSMEELFTHNQVKTAYAYAIMHLLKDWPKGIFVGDRMLLTNVAANLGSEPDGLFAFWDTLQSGRLSTIAGAEGFTELSGSADMVLEVVSKYSVRKDTVLLRDLYYKANIPEFWLVDARGSEPRFDILRHTEQGYIAVEPAGGWLMSPIFQREFQLVKGANPLGNPQFVVNVKDVS